MRTIREIVKELVRRGNFQLAKEVLTSFESEQKTFKEQFDILNLPGRCSTGSERGRGCLWHAVPIEYHSGLCPKTNSETVLIGQLGVLPNKVNTSLKLVKYSI